MSEQPKNENASPKCEINLQYFVNGRLCQGNEAYQMHAPSPLSHHDIYSTLTNCKLTMLWNNLGDLPQPEAGVGNASHFTGMLQTASVQNN